MNKQKLKLNIIIYELKEENMTGKRKPWVITNKMVIWIWRTCNLSTFQRRKARFTIRFKCLALTVSMRSLFHFLSEFHFLWDWRTVFKNTAWNLSLTSLNLDYNIQLILMKRHSKCHFGVFGQVNENFWPKRVVKLYNKL